MKSKDADNIAKAYEKVKSKKLVKDKKTGEMYDPDEEFDKLMNSKEYIAMLKRMKNEEGRGWPKREK